MLNKFSWGKRDLWAVVVFVHFSLLILLLLVALAYLNLGFNFSTETMVSFASLFLLIVAIWSLWSWRATTGSLFDPYIVLFIATVLFNGGQAFLELLGLNKHGILEGSFSPET